MVIVALYALFVLLLKNECDLSERAAEFDLKAREHQKKLGHYQAELWMHRYNSSHGHAFWDDRIAVLERCEKYEELMYHKHRLAASYPCRTITPDPAPPAVPPTFRLAQP
jgi:hypothetical protein